MTNAQQLERLFEQAVEAIPYNPSSTSIIQGSFEPANGFVEYSEEFTFRVGNLLDEDLTAGGWVELRQEDGETYISGFFGIARDGDWEKGRILPDELALQGVYDLEKKSWEFWIDAY